MSKHTEGPWEWANGTHALVGPKIDDKPVWLRPVVLRSETGVRAEDARLIAAAPALLEALQASRACIWTDRMALADVHTSANGIDEDGAAGVAEYDEVIAQIDTAIAAATGQG